jgi:hypothetical protein
MRIFWTIFIVLGLWFLVWPSTTLATVSNWKKSATINPKSIDDYGSDNFRASVLQAKKDNFNWITLVIPLYQNNLYSVDIYKGWNTPTDQSLLSAINFIHS